MYPKGARPNRWQSLHVVCKDHNHHKPVYSLQRHRDVWHVGASAKMRFTESFQEWFSAIVKGFVFLLDYRGKTLERPPAI